MFDEAKARLRRLEASHGIRILYACEAGSRSWGFPSPSSDYDIRFIYVRPLKNYLKLTPPADTITLDQDGVWDISGWDLKKCLMLLKKGNVSIVQSLYSQIVYRNHPLFLAEMRKLLDYGAPLPRLYWAYRSMAQSHVSHFLLGHETIAYKRFLYIVQGLLPCAGSRPARACRPWSSSNSPTRSSRTRAFARRSRRFSTFSEAQAPLRKRVPRRSSPVC